MNEEVLIELGAVSEKTMGGSNQFCQETSGGPFRFSFTWPHPCL